MLKKKGGGGVANEMMARFHGFYNQIDQFKANHFLWLSAGGTKVAELNKESDKTEVDKALGDEDENPEGGEG